jgi:NMD protein affecting ribosome stability and mRNA decay
MMQFKVKRCGVGGTMFVVKSRVDQEAKAELEAIEEKMLTKKNKKNNK